MENSVLGGSSAIPNLEGSVVKFRVARENQAARRRTLRVR
jgi:hypothetical protein